MTPELKRRRVLQYFHRVTMFSIYEVKLVDGTDFHAPSLRGYMHIYLVRSDGYELYIGRIKEEFAHEIVGMLRRAIARFMKMRMPLKTADYLQVENEILRGVYDFKPELAG